MQNACKGIPFPSSAAAPTARRKRSTAMAGGAAPSKRVSERGSATRHRRGAEALQAGLTFSPRIPVATPQKTNRTGFSARDPGACPSRAHCRTARRVLGVPELGRRTLCSCYGAPAGDGVRRADGDELPQRRMEGGRYHRGSRCPEAGSMHGNRTERSTDWRSWFWSPPRSPESDTGSGRKTQRVLTKIWTRVGIRAQGNPTDETLESGQISRCRQGRRAHPRRALGHHGRSTWCESVSDSGARWPSAFFAPFPARSSRREIPADAPVVKKEGAPVDFPRSTRRAPIDTFLMKVDPWPHAECEGELDTWYVACLRRSAGNPIGRRQ